MRVLGIDPSLTSTGLALVEGGEVQAWRRVRSKLKGYERVDEILEAVELLAEDADVVGIEGPAMSAKGSSVVQIFGLWGILTQRLWQIGKEPYVVAPSARVKYATGKGNSSKDEVLAAVVRRYTDVDVTGNDVADALIIAAMGARKYDEPLEANLPQANLEAMEKVQWADASR